MFLRARGVGQAILPLWGRFASYAKGAAQTEEAELKTGHCTGKNACATRNVRMKAGIAGFKARST